MARSRSQQSSRESSVTRPAPLREIPAPPPPREMPRGTRRHLQKDPHSTHTTDFISCRTVAGQSGRYRRGDWTPNRLAAARVYHERKHVRNRSRPEGDAPCIQRTQIRHLLAVDCTGARRCHAQNHRHRVQWDAQAAVLHLGRHPGGVSSNWFASITDSSFIEPRSFFFRRFSAILPDADDFIVDYPKLWEYLAETIVPIFADGVVPLSFVASMSAAGKKEKAAPVVAAVVKELVNKQVFFVKTLPFPLYADGIELQVRMESALGRLQLHGGFCLFWQPNQHLSLPPTSDLSLVRLLG